MWLVKDQKEDTEEEKVGGISVLNKQNIYTMRVLVQQIEESVRTDRFDFREKVGICLSAHRLDECGTKPFLCGYGRRAVAQTRPATPKMSRAPSAFPKEGVPQAPGDKPSPSKKPGGRPLRLEDAGLGAPEMNARFSGIHVRQP